MGEISLEKADASVCAWVNHVRYGDTYGLRRSILSNLRLDAQEGEIARNSIPDI